MRYIGVMVVVIASAAAVGTAQPPSSLSDLGGPRNLSGQRVGPKPSGWRNVGPTQPGIWANIAAHPSGAVYVASMGGGVRKSNDFGATWTSVNAGLPPAAVSFAMDASGPETVYVGVFSAAATAPGGVFKSTDGRAKVGAQPRDREHRALALEADPSNPRDRLHGRAWRGVAQDDQRRSVVDNFVQRHLTNWLGQIDPTNGNNVYMATLAGAWRSLDGGASWSRMTALTAPNVWGIGIESTSPNVVYAATNDNGVWRSTNNGNTWQAISPALTAYDVAVDPTYSSNIYAATRTGVWWSGDAGATWQPSGLTRGAYSIVADSGVLYAGTTVPRLA